MHTYFQQLNQTLKWYHNAIPFLLVDLDRLDENIDTLRLHISPMSDLRLVVKSLPSKDLISYIMERAATSKLMVFHQPFLNDIAQWANEKVDILLGKPMPVTTVEYFFKQLNADNSKFNPTHQIQWLVDTPKRIVEYVELSKRINQKLKINLELNVGLHRGGVGNIEQLKHCLDLLLTHSNNLTFSGYMGYDPHVVKLPKIVRSQKKSLSLANSYYRKCKEILKNEYPDLWHEGLIFNGAGSPTVLLHNTEDSPLNDLAVGSALVKPSTFDIPTLKDFKPASFIATPILKKFEHTTLPGLEKITRIISLFNPSYKKSYFIYGGYWKAEYCYPKGIKENGLFGASTNQTMLNAKADVELEIDDFVFLRPLQSEFVFLQFGKIKAIRKHQIVQEFQLLNNSF